MSKKRKKKINVFPKFKQFSTDSLLSSTPTINKEKPIIGIDLGTTYLSVSIFKNNICILKNKNGKRTIQREKTIEAAKK